MEDIECTNHILKESMIYLWGYTRAEMKPVQLSFVYWHKTGKLKKEIVDNEFEVLVPAKPYLKAFAKHALTKRSDLKRKVKGLEAALGLQVSSSSESGSSQQKNADGVQHDDGNGSAHEPVGIEGLFGDGIDVDASQMHISESDMVDGDGNDIHNEKRAFESDGENVFSPPDKKKQRMNKK